MRRRDFIVRTAATALLTALSSTYAEAGERIWRMGVLTPVGDSLVRSVILPHLATRGFVEGRNLAVDLRIGTAEQMPELAQALVGDKPDVIIANSDWAVHAARAATSTIPIVAAPMGADPVRAGVAESWAHPGGNVTGVSLIAPELDIKRLSLLREALPSVHPDRRPVQSSQGRRSGLVALTQGRGRRRT